MDDDGSFPIPPPRIEASEELSSSNALDVVDAKLDDSNDHTTTSSPSLLSSSPCLTAAQVLMGPTSPWQTGGDVIQKFQPSEEKRDCVATLHEVFRFDEPRVFSANGACEAVKHFFPVELDLDCVTSNTDDITDANAGSFQDEVDLPPLMNQSVMTVKPNLQGTRSTKFCTVNLEEEYRYKMDKPERGCFVIFNQEKFDLYNKTREKWERMSNRDGTNMDASNLENTVKQLGFEYVKVIKDATKAEILQWISILSTADHTNYDCFGCAILTHGGDKDILFARDDIMHLKDFTRPFGADRCPTLAAKPKLFFIQACRGTKLDSGKRLLKSSGNDEVDGLVNASGDVVDGRPGQLEILIPAEADFLIANSTVPEYYSWRNETNGSFFIQSLCAVFNACDSMEIMQIMTRVNRMVAYEYESSSTNQTFDKKKQIPSIATRLTAELYFLPKLVEQQVHFTPPQATAHVQTYSASQYQSRVVQCERPDHIAREEIFTSTASVESSTSEVYANYNTPHRHTQPITRKKFYPDPQVRHIPKVALSVPQSDELLSKSPPSSLLTTPDLIRRAGNTPSRKLIAEFRKRSGSTSESLISSLESHMHKSETVPHDIAHLHQSSAGRKTEHRRSLPENSRRLVQQPLDNLLKVGDRKTNPRYEESDV